MKKTLFIKVILSLLLCINSVKSDCESDCRKQICKEVNNLRNDKTLKEEDIDSSIESKLKELNCKCLGDSFNFNSCIKDEDKKPITLVTDGIVGVAIDTQVIPQSESNNQHSSSSNINNKQQSSSGNTDNKQQSSSGNTGNKQQSSSGNTDNKQQSSSGHTSNEHQSSSGNTGNEQLTLTGEYEDFEKVDENLKSEFKTDKNTISSNSESKSEVQNENGNQSFTNSKLHEPNVDTNLDINYQSPTGSIGNSPDNGSNSPDNESNKKSNKNETNEVKNGNSFTKVSLIVIIAGVTIILTSTVVSVHRRKANEKDDEFKNYIKESQSFLIEPDENPEIISIDNKPFYVKRKFSDDDTDNISYSQTQSQFQSQPQSFSQSPTLYYSNSPPQSPTLTQFYSQSQSQYQFKYNNSISNPALPDSALSYNSNTDEYLSVGSMPWLFLNNNSQRLGDL